MHKLLDAKYCTLHSSCTYDPNNKSEVDTTCAHHTVTEQYTFSVPLFSIFFSLPLSSFTYSFILSSFYYVFCTFCHWLGLIIYQNYSSTVNLAELTDWTKNNQLHKGEHVSRSLTVTLLLHLPIYNTYPHYYYSTRTFWFSVFHSFCK